MTALQPVNTEVTDLATQAKSLIVADNTAFEVAGEILRNIAALRKRIAEHHEEVIRKAHEAHKAAIRARESVDQPLAKADAELRRKCSDYLAELRRIEAAKQREAEELARREREAAIEAAAEKAEAEGASIREVEAIIRHAEMAPLVAVPVAVEQPKAEGVSSREKWEAQVTDRTALFRAAAERPDWQVFFAVNVSALNQWARMTKGTVQIPGVQVYRADSISVRSK